MIVTLKSLCCFTILNAQRLPTVGRANRCAQLMLGLLHDVQLASTDDPMSQGGLNPGGALSMTRPTQWRFITPRHAILILMWGQCHWESEKAQTILNYKTTSRDWQWPRKGASVHRDEHGVADLPVVDVFQVSSSWLSIHWWKVMSSVESIISRQLCILTRTLARFHWYSPWRSA